MAANLLLSIQDATVSFGVKPLFDEMSFTIQEREKICLVGKNGVGKTTLMKMITGAQELDKGKRWESPGIAIGYLPQDVHPNSHETVFDFIFQGLPEEQQNEEHRYKVEKMLTPLMLHGESKMDEISGGQLRRAALARALVEKPDILLLDEPTNHLDLSGILWLESYIKQYQGALLCISHDKTFLSNISQKVFWLDRGRMRICPKGFGHFDEWSQLLLEQEARELANRSRALAEEAEWASRGVKARRKRNMRRLNDMLKERAKLKADKSLFNQTMRKIELEPLKAGMTSKVVAEFYNVSKSFERGGKTHKILDRFNLRVMRGDRIGILGHNGSGKTTFLSLLTGNTKADSGTVKVKKNIDFSYFDQKRRDLDITASIKKNLCPGGGDYIDVGDKQRHVCGYLKDFLFDPKMVHDLVTTLSGGQKNRLLLAKVLANPGGMLILDEPTNDLDMDTLDMLEEVLAEYKGTLFVVSHDRDFLDQTVSKILAFEGDGVVEGHIGGYSDYLAEKGGLAPKKGDGKKEKKQQEKAPKASKKLSYKLQYELDHLPGKIEKIEQEIAQCHTRLEDANFYTEDPDGFDKAVKRVAQLQEELEQLESRWLELEEMSDNS